MSDEIPTDEELDEILDKIDWSKFVPRPVPLSMRWKSNRLIRARIKRANPNAYHPPEKPWPKSKRYHQGAHGTQFWDKHHGRSWRSDHWRIRDLFERPHRRGLSDSVP